MKVFFNLAFIAVFAALIGLNGIVEAGRGGKESGKPLYIISGGGSDPYCLFYEAGVACDGNLSLIAHQLGDGEARGVLSDSFGKGGEAHLSAFQTDIDCIVVSDDGKKALMSGDLKLVDKKSPYYGLDVRVAFFVADDVEGFGDGMSFSFYSLNPDFNCEYVLGNHGDSVDQLFEDLVEENEIFPVENGQVKILKQ